MLIEFKVTNFRSILKTQALSLAATESADLKDKNIFSSAVEGLPHLVKSAVIYGPNAAGKSNFIGGLKFMQDFVKNSAKESQGGELIDVVPFLLDSLSPHSATEFEVLFTTQGVLYEYGFALTHERVMREWLFAYPEGQAQKWFERHYDSDMQTETWTLNSKYLKGRRKTWRDSTRANALFLSTAVMLNSVTLKPILEWMTQHLVILESFQEVANIFTLQQCEKTENKHQIMTFLQAADLGIVDMSVENLMNPIAPSIISFWHIENDQQTKIPFPEHYESAGTLRLFALAGYLLNVLEKGQTLVIDEMDTSLHPMMMRFVIEMVHNSALNKPGTQMILTTHDSSILDNSLLRPDQIWFVEKDRLQATQLYPLTDFIERQNESLQKGYLEGRYGALPCLTQFTFDEN